MPERKVDGVEVPADATVLRAFGSARRRIDKNDGGLSPMMEAAE